MHQGEVGWALMPFEKAMVHSICCNHGGYVCWKPSISEQMLVSSGNLPDAFVFGWEKNPFQKLWARHVLRWLVGWFCTAKIVSQEARREDLQRQESSLKERLLSQVGFTV